MEPSREEILKAMEQVIDPELKRNVVELDMVRDVRIEGGDVTIGIALTIAGCPLRASFEEQVAAALAPVAGVPSFHLFKLVRNGLLIARNSTLTSRPRGHKLVVPTPTTIFEKEGLVWPSSERMTLPHPHPCPRRRHQRSDRHRLPACPLIRACGFAR